MRPTVARMTRFGYTLMTEQSGPRALVDYAVGAERAGYDFLVSSDHYSPWLTSQGRVPNYEASMSKVYGAEWSQRIAQTGMKVVTAFALTGTPAERRPRERIDP